MFRPEPTGGFGCGVGEVLLVGREGSSQVVGGGFVVVQFFFEVVDGCFFCLFLESGKEVGSERIFIDRPDLLPYPTARAGDSTNEENL